MNIGLHKVSKSAGQFSFVAFLAPSVGEVDVDMGRLGIWRIVVILLGSPGDLFVKRLLLNRQDSVIAACRTQHFREFNSKCRNFVVESEVWLFVGGFAPWYRNARDAGSGKHVSLDSFLFSIHARPCLQMRDSGKNCNRE